MVNDCVCAHVAHEFSIDFIGGLTLMYAVLDDLIRVVTLHATVMASGSLTYLVGCSIASHDSYQVSYL